MKTTTYTLIIIVTMWVGSFATASAQKSLQKARALKDNFEYVSALSYYNDYIKLNEPSIETSREIAESYLKINDNRSAEKWYEKVNTFTNRTSADVLSYAHALRANARYAEAQVQYETYKSLNPADASRAARWIEACNASQTWMSEPSYFKVENAEAFNSPNADFGLMPFNNEYIVTSDRRTAGNNEIYSWTGKPYLKLFSYTDVNENFTSGKEKAIGAINNDFHNGPTSFSKSASTLFFTRTKQVKVKMTPINNDPTSWIDYTPNTEYVSRLEIYTADFNNGAWGNITPFAYNNADNFSVGHPALSSDGKTLYFVSDKPGGRGGTDIWYCILNDNGSWSSPQNAGDVINTDGNEMFPYMDADGKFYFSSTGHPGMGGLDIFKADGALNTWTQPENMKYPINSPADDFSVVFTENDKKGFLASNREGGKGDDDIYHFELLPPRNMTIVAITKEKIDAINILPLGNVTLEYLNTTTQTTETYSTDANGKHIISGNCDEELKITALRDGFLSNYKVINTTCVSYNDTMYVELILDKIIIGKPYAIKNIFYNFDKYDIRDDAKPELDNIVTVLTENPKINIELGSHTDSRGTKPYNNWLSQMRAESAVAYIVSRGIDPARITAKGYGETELLNECSDGVRCSDEAHQLNRRTEFKVTSISN